MIRIMNWALVMILIKTTLSKVSGTGGNGTGLQAMVKGDDILDGVAVVQLTNVERYSYAPSVLIMVVHQILSERHLYFAR